MSKPLTSSEVQKHNTRNSIWIVLKNDVYDVTAYLNAHPGGEDPLLEAAGMDATLAFETVGHSVDARTLLEKYKIGSLAKGESCSRMAPKIWMSSSKYHQRCTESDLKSSTSKPSQTSLRKTRSNSPTSKNRDCLSRPPCKSSNSAMIRPDTVSALLPKSSNVSTTSPRIIPRVPAIVVPRRRPARRRKAAPPPSSSKWKWILLALAAAIIAGVAYKKYAT